MENLIQLGNALLGSAEAAPEARTEYHNPLAQFLHTYPMLEYAAYLIILLMVANFFLNWFDPQKK